MSEDNHYYLVLFLYDRPHLFFKYNGTDKFQHRINLLT